MLKSCPNQLWRKNSGQIGWKALFDTLGPRLNVCCMTIARAPPAQFLCIGYKRLLFVILPDRSFRGSRETDFLTNLWQTVLNNVQSFKALIRNQVSKVSGLWRFREFLWILTQTKANVASTTGDRSWHAIPEVLSRCVLVSQHATVMVHPERKTHGVRTLVAPVFFSFRFDVQAWLKHLLNGQMADECEWVSLFLSNLFLCVCLSLTIKSHSLSVFSSNFFSLLFISFSPSYGDKEIRSPVFLDGTRDRSVRKKKCIDTFRLEVFPINNSANTTRWVLA